MAASDNLQDASGPARVIVPTDALIAGATRQG